MDFEARARTPSRTALAVAWLAMAGCEGAPWNTDQFPAPDFALVDENAGSPDFGTERRLSDQAGKVIILYFANYE